MPPMNPAPRHSAAGSSGKLSPDRLWLGAVGATLLVAALASEISPHPRTFLWVVGIFGIGLTGLGWRLLRQSESRTRQTQTRVNELESRLEALESRHLALRNLDPTCLKTLDRNGRILEMNAAGLAMLAAPNFEAVRGKSFEEFVHPEDIERLRAQLTKARTEKADTVQFRARTLEGRERWMESRVTLLPPTGGAEITLLSVTRDITEIRELSRTLRENERRFALFMDHFPGLIWLATPDGRLQFVNAAFQSQLGLRVEDLIGKTAHEVLPPEIASSIRARDREVLATGMATAVVERIPIAGQARHLLNVRFLIDRSPEPPLLGGTSTDVTELVEAREALARSEEKFRTLSESSPVAICMCDARGGVVYVNNRWSELTGRTAEQSLGDGWSQAIQPEDRAVVLQSWRSQAAAGEAVSDDLVVQLPSGERRWLHSRSTPIFDCHGILTGHVATHEDITALKQAMHSAEEAHQRLQAILDHAAEAIIALDQEGRIGVFNKAAEGMFGYCEAGSANIPINTLFTSLGDRPTSHQSTAAFVDTLRSLSAICEANGVRRDGSSFSAEISTGSMNSLSNAGLVIVVRDVSERAEASRRRETLERQLAQSQRLEAVGTLAGGIAHDFNNILGAILGFAEILRQDTEREPEKQSYVTHIIQAAQRAAGLVRQMLTFSREQASELQPLDLASLAKETGRLLRAALPANIELDVECQPRTPEVMADPAKVHQILVNLGANARDAIGTRPGRLRIHTRERLLSSEEAASHLGLKAGNHAELTVEDNGEGMTPEVQRRVFDPFFTTKETGAGSGLGLAVVHGIVRSHQGEIQVESTPGSGTRITILIPALRTPAPAPALSLEAVSSDVASGRRLLLVDDEEPLLIVGEMVLRRLGYEVVAETHPEKALALIADRSEPFHGLITDMTMPTMSGITLAVEARRLRSSLPILFLTGNLPKLTADQNALLGHCEVLPKPLGANALATAAAKLVNLSQEPPIKR